MKSKLVRALALLLIASVHFASAAPAATPLFDGKSLKGWSIQNGGRFSVRDGVIAIDRGHGWLRSDETYADFVLVLEFRFLEAKANSGVFVRTGPTSKPDEKGYPDNGYQVQCMDIVDGARPLGALLPYGAGVADHKTDLAAIKRAFRPVKEWNTFEITCRGSSLLVKLNGIEVTRASGLKNLRGHVGLQAELGLLEFRRIDLTQLPAEAASVP